MEIDADSLRAKGFALERSPNEDSPSPDQTRLVLIDLEYPKIAPLFVDFASPQLRHRLKHGLSKNQPLPKALGLKSFSPLDAPSVIDATAGLGIDAWVMAAMGCKVLAIERHPVVFALLEDGLRRFRHFAANELHETGEKVWSEIAARLTVERGDATEILSRVATHQAPPDVVHIDPMYPDEGKSKSALPKKGMQMFRRLIGDADLDAHEILRVSLLAAKCRVVVKRPLHAPVLGGKPTHTFTGKTARYDLYVTKR